MRVKALEISGFRAFKGSHRFDLDADIVLVIGVNGQGKTSFFDAILWAITGEIPRLERSDSVVSLYSRSGETRVQVSVASEDGPTIVVTRQSDGQRGRLQVKAGDSVYTDEDAEHQLIRHLWPEGLRAHDPRLALRSALQHGVYLQQDLLTGFLTAETDQERFNAFSELIGAGAATEFQASLESSRRAWSRATNLLEDELKKTEGRLGWLEGQLRELEDDSPSVMFDTEEWTAWWTQLKDFGVTQVAVPALEASEAPGALDAAMAELRAIRLSHERRREDLRALETVLLQLPDANFNMEELDRAAEISTEELATARNNLTEGEAIISDARRLQAEARSQQQDLIFLADVALRHLGDHCPVCLQSYDREGTRERLEALRHSADPSIVPQHNLPDLPQLERQVQYLERDVSTTAAAQQQAQRQQRLRMDGQARIRVGLAELAINVQTEGDFYSSIETALEENAQQLDRLSAARARGEVIALSLARTGQLARKNEIAREVLQVKNELELARTEFETRRDTGELVTNMIEGIRRASSDLVENELRRTESLLQRIYSTADPHPEFRVVRLLSRMRQGHGRIVAEVEDPIHNLRNDSPSSLLSSSQMNVLAVAVFLSLNLGTHTLPLKTVILDDPLQSLDDLNLLGLIDLLKRIRERRQLIISTHNSQFASLLERKLRPISSSQRTVRVELSGWSSEGPMVAQTDVDRDLMPIKIAAA